MTQFVYPIWGVHSSRAGMIVGRATLALAADATRYHNPAIRACRLFVTAPDADTARRVACDYEWQTRGTDKGVSAVRHAATGLPVLMRDANLAGKLEWLEESSTQQLPTLYGCEES